MKEFLNHNSVWTEQLKPHVPARNPLQRRFQSVVGMGGFYSLLTAQDGFSVVARVAFYQFCEDIDASTLGKFARFVESCFRLRLCDEPQVRCGPVGGAFLRHPQYWGGKIYISRILQLNFSLFSSLCRCTST